MEVSDAHTVIRGAAQAFMDACELVGLIEVLRIGNDPKIIEAINRQKIGATAGVIRTSLLTRLNVVLCRHFLPPHKGDFSARRTFDLLDSDEVRNQVMEGKTSTQLEEARFAWRMCMRDERMKPYLHLRHKSIAHISDGDPVLEGLLNFKDIFGVTENAIRCFDLMANSVMQTTTDLKFEREERRKNAAKFWEALM